MLFRSAPVDSDPCLSLLCSVRLPAAWAWAASWVTARPAWRSAAPPLLPGGPAPWAGAYTTRAASLGLVSVQWQCGRRGSIAPHTNPHLPTLLSSQSRPAAEGSRSQAPWAGGGPYLSSLRPWRPVSPRASCLACTCSPSSSRPTPPSLTRWGARGWGPVWSVEGLGLRVFIFQMDLYHSCVYPLSLYVQGSDFPY